MVIGRNKFIYLSKQQGVTQNGEKYLAINVIDDEDKKLSFMTTNSKLIDEILQFTFTKYSDITLEVAFTREYNKNRYSYWSAELLGVG